MPDTENQKEIPVNKINVAAEIARRNKLFKGKTNAQKRVLIAKDVIKQLACAKITAEWGVFCELHFDSDPAFDDFDRIDKEASIQELLISDKIENCNVCALGALMVSATLFNNKETIADFNKHFENLGDAIRDSVPLDNRLNTIFSKKQLELIECAFERGTGYFATYHESEGGELTPEFQKASDFGQEYLSDSKRMIRIMENLIENKGIFKP